MDTLWTIYVIGLLLFGAAYFGLAAALRYAEDRDRLTPDERFWVGLLEEELASNQHLVTLLLWPFVLVFSAVWWGIHWYHTAEDESVDSDDGER